MSALRGMLRGVAPEARRRRLRMLSVAASLAGALLLSLGAMASAAQTAPPGTLVLDEAINGSIQCVSPDTSCTVNKYGINGAPVPPLIAPGNQFTTTVELTNGGTLTGSSLELAGGPCRNTGPGGVGAPGGDLCGLITVTITCCQPGAPPRAQAATLAGAARVQPAAEDDPPMQPAAVDLLVRPAAAPTFTLGPISLAAFAQSGTHTVFTGLAPGASVLCTFTVTYPPDGPFVFSTRAIQAVAWTLTGEEAPPTTVPPTTAPPTTAPPGTAPPGVTPPAVTPPGAVVTTPRAPGALAFTGGDTLPLALAGLVLLVLGGLLYWFSRPRAPDLATASEHPYQDDDRGG